MLLEGRHGSLLLLMRGDIVIATYINCIYYIYIYDNIARKGSLYFIQSCKKKAS